MRDDADLRPITATTAKLRRILLKDAVARGVVGATRYTGEPNREPNFDAFQAGVALAAGSAQPQSGDLRMPCLARRMVFATAISLVAPSACSGRGEPGRGAPDGRRAALTAAGVQSDRQAGLITGDLDPTVFDPMESFAMEEQK